LRNEGIFTPPSVQGALAIPGNIGGMNWSGYAFDPAHHTLLVNTTNLAFKVKLIPADKFDEAVAHAERGEYAPQTGAPYAMYRNPIFSPAGLPCGAPPWGTLTAVDMTEGKIRWQVPLGSLGSFAPGAPVPPGSPTFGGPIVTAGGLVFIAGTIDPFLRAFDVETGKELWKGQLPASGHATPMTYKLASHGKQFLVIAAGGHAKITEEPQSDAIVAFTLP
jgi:quinoprotein glucose dehydrogenase